jgi:hypothetical protein
MKMLYIHTHTHTHNGVLFSHKEWNYVITGKWMDSERQVLHIFSHI